jgi:hypothetical protein
MTNPSTKTSPLTYARIAGILYLVITIAAIVAHFIVPEEIIVTGDAEATAQNIVESETLFRFGAIGGELLILLSEIVLSIILYVLLKPVSKTLSLIAAVSRLAMTTIHGLNLLNYFFVLLLLGDDSYLTVFEPDQLNALVLLFLEAHSYGFAIGIAFLAIHVFVLGYLIYRSGFFPKILGILFIVAAVGYSIDTFAILVTDSYDTTPAIIALMIAVGELAFPLWLLIKGVNAQEWEKRALEA